MVHSYNSIEDPLRLTYGYEKQYAEVVAYLDDKNGADPVSALFIGGGGYTFPRYMRVKFPDSNVTVIEIDPFVTAIAHEHLEIGRAHV